MSDLVLSRKYRPKTFDGVLGQKNALQILESFISNNSLPHALIFCGSRGVGKTSMARIFAKTINCDELLKSNKCSDYNTCSCKEIDENKSIDVIEIDAASNNGVDQIRDVIDSSNYSSIKCKYKVFIIDEVHMLSKAAFNALLKTLEEPNKNTVFILATTEVEKIPLTIISRCQTINFKNIKKEIISSYVSSIAKQEGIDIDDESVVMISEESNGSARDALGFLELLSTTLNKQIEVKEASKILGKTTKQVLSKITEGIIKSDVESVLKEYNNIYEGGYDSKKFVLSLMNYFRAAIYYKLSLEKSVDDIDLLVDTEIKKFENYDLETLENLFDELIKLYDLSSKSDNVRFVVESHLIKLCMISNFVDFNLIEDIDRVQVASVNKESKKKRLAKTKKDFDSEYFLNNLKEAKNENYKLIKDAKISLNSSKIEIKLDNSIMFELLNNKEKKEEIEKLINETFDVAYKIEIIKPDNDINGFANGNEFKFKDKKDKLLESESVKNLFDTFDCRIQDVEVEN